MRRGCGGLCFSFILASASWTWPWPCRAGSLLPPSRRHERVGCMLRPAKKWTTWQDGGKAGEASGGPGVASVPGPKAGARAVPGAARGSRLCGSCCGAPPGPWVLVFLTRRCLCPSCPPAPRLLKLRSSEAFSLHRPAPLSAAAIVEAVAPRRLLQDSPLAQHSLPTPPAADAAGLPHLLSLPPFIYQT